MVKGADLLWCDLRSRLSALALNGLTADDLVHHGGARNE
jgi:hypothetical protein